MRRHMLRDGTEVRVGDILAPENQSPERLSRFAGETLDGRPILQRVESGLFLAPENPLHHTAWKLHERAPQEEEEPEPTEANPVLEARHRNADFLRAVEAAARQFDIDAYVVAGHQFTNGEEDMLPRVTCIGYDDSEKLPGMVEQLVGEIKGYLRGVRSVTAVKRAMDEAQHSHDLSVNMGELRQQGRRQCGTCGGVGVVSPEGIAVYCPACNGSGEQEL